MTDPAAGQRRVLRRSLTQVDFDRFAALSGDDNPIHVDPAYAARTRFGRTVSHGILLVAILRGLADSTGTGLRLVRHEVRFPAPTFAGEDLSFEVWPDDGALAFACRRADDGEVTCDGRFTLAPLGGVAGTGRGGGAASGAAGSAPAASNSLGHAGLHVGASARTQRAFSPADVAEYRALGGEPAGEGLVPEPLVSALFSYLLGVHLPGPGANYLKQETDFLQPPQVGEALTATVEITRLRPEKSLVDLATTCTGENGRRLATGRALIFVGDRAA